MYASIYLQTLLIIIYLYTDGCQHLGLDVTNPSFIYNGNAAESKLILVWLSIQCKQDESQRLRVIPVKELEVESHSKVESFIDTD